MTDKKNGGNATSAASTNLDVALVREYAATKLERDRLDSELGKVKSKLTRMEEPVRNALIDAGVPSFKVIVDDPVLGETMLTVHLWKQQRGRRREGIAKGAVADILREVGLSDLTSFGYEWNTLDSYVREQVGLDPSLATIPKELQDVLDIYEHVEARTKKG